MTLTGNKLITAIAALLVLLFIIITNIIAAPKEYQAGVTFLPDETFLPALLRDIGGAEKEIWCALYMFRTEGNTTATGAVKNALTEAAKRGVYVGIVFDIGNRNDLTTQYNTATGKVLSQAGINVVFDDADRRMHAKMCVIDGSISFIGSHNYTHSGLQRNSEVTVRINSVDIAGQALDYMRNLGLE